MARISRISVIRLTPAANQPDSRAPARPPSASATASSTEVTAGVRRAWLLVSPLTCSAKVTFAHSGRRRPGGDPRTFNEETAGVKRIKQETAR